jgi:hypothetical protein
VCADYNHYCFGDYYDSAHVGRGIYPWGQAGQYIHGFYDPMRVAYLAGAAAGARAEFDRILAWHRFFRTHPSARPPTTLSASLRLRIEGDDERSHQAVRQALLARPLSQLADSTESSSRLVLVPESRLDEIRQSARQTVDLADRASRLASARTSGNDARTNLRLALPRMAAPSSSTLVGAERAGRVRGEVPEAPQFDEEHAANRSRESPRSSRK